MKPADAYAAARAAQPAWAGRPLADRVAIMREFHRLVDQRRNDLATILTNETGKPISQSRNELAGVLPRIEFFLDETERVLEPHTVLDDESHALREQITFEPLGVVLNISAWNYPWFVGSNVFVPALLTGNAVLYKPSELATETGHSIEATLHDAGVPDHIFVAVSGDGDVGAQLLAQPIDGVFFTGSYATGRKIAETVAGRMIPVQLELGGKDPVYVADDVDVRAAAEGLADGAFYNSGQSCCSVERIYIHRSIYDAFVDAFVEMVDGFRVGDPNDDATYIGPLTRPQQIAVLEDQVADAVGKGARVRVGGHRVGDRDGAWFEPTVLTDVDHTMQVMRDESFGPIIGVQRVADDDEAVDQMNDTDYGLTAGVYSADEARARRILEQLDAGSAYWNCCDRVSPRLPWSGRGHSGMGSTLSTLGIQAFVKPKAWHLRNAYTKSDEATS
jgi:acyl-CoA reductase-like NAD-dependent aldehyde dehydrogenase